MPERDATLGVVKVIARGLRVFPFSYALSTKGTGLVFPVGLFCGKSRGKRENVAEHEVRIIRHGPMTHISSRIVQDVPLFVHLLYAAAPVEIMRFLASSFLVSAFRSPSFYHFYFRWVRVRAHLL